MYLFMKLELREMLGNCLCYVKFNRCSIGIDVLPVLTYPKFDPDFAKIVWLHLLFNTLFITVGGRDFPCLFITTMFTTAS